MNKKGKYSSMEKGLALALVAIVAVLAYTQTGGEIPLEAADTGTGTGGAAGDSVGYQATMTMRTLNVYDGQAATNGVRAILITPDGQKKAAEFTVNADPDTLGTLPTTYSGSILVGNDNYVVSSDLGSEIYMTRFPVAWSNEGDPDIGTVSVYNESTVTWYAYDGNSEETVLNVTIGSGGEYLRADLEIQAGTDLCIGNPDFKKLAIAFNCTNQSTTNKFDEIRPKTGSYVGTDNLPEFLSGYSFLGGLYILPAHTFVCDGAISNKIPLYIKAKAGNDPIQGDECYGHILDWSYYFDDQNRLTAGWEDKSTINADGDVGIDTLSNSVTIGFA
jgi:hypothetical protein